MPTRLTDLHGSEGVAMPNLQPPSDAIFAVPFAPWPWAANAFTIRRPAHVIGPTVAAYGIGAGSTGTRADLLVCDDVVDVSALAQQSRPWPGRGLLRQQPDEPPRARRSVLEPVYAVARRRPQRSPEKKPEFRALPAGPSARISSRSGPRSGHRSPAREEQELPHSPNLPDPLRR